MSTAGGYSEAVRRVAEMGGNCLQIFSTSPRGWRPAKPGKEEKDRFKKAVKEYSVSPVYFHASYLINLAGSMEVQEKSISSMIAELKVAGDFGVKGTTVHLGSFKKGKLEDGGNLVRVQGPGNWKKPYHASFVEMGTYKDEAKPFMRPALRKNKNNANKKFRDALDKL